MLFYRNLVMEIVIKRKILVICFFLCKYYLSIVHYFYKIIYKLIIKCSKR